MHGVSQESRFAVEALKLKACHIAVGARARQWSTKIHRIAASSPRIQYASRVATPGPTSDRTT